jgi:hypothetical protein
MRCDRSLRILLPSAFLSLLVAFGSAATEENAWLEERRSDGNRVLVQHNAEGDKAFFFCSTQGLKLGLIPRFSGRPSPGIDASRAVVTLSINDQPTTDYSLVSYEGAYFGEEPLPPNAKQAVKTGHWLVVDWQEPVSLVLETPRNDFSLNISGAVKRIRWPALCKDLDP